MPVTLHRTSIIPARPDRVWNRIASAEGINGELAPLMRMTVPEGLKDKTIDDVELGKPLGRSWFLLAGLLPFDYDDIVLAEREKGCRFRETSSMLSIRSWQHERTLRAVDAGTEVTDRISFELRWPFSAIPGMAEFVTRVLTFLFEHRHRRLAEWFERRGDN
ncbi:MAG TPA: hypothetical protein VGU20_02440 [Stellaceae bacterium]|nr:hypothetical protein [Stellaceae bacterium]